MPDYQIQNNFFTSKYYDNCPTFTILHVDKSYDVKTAMNVINSRTIDYMFLIFNGQQVRNVKVENQDMAERAFGRELTGLGFLLNNKNKWINKYIMYSGTEHASVASELTAYYGENAIIVNILNAKYSWEKNKKNKAYVIEYMMSSILDPLLNAFTNSGQTPKIGILGFSRGGCVSLIIGRELVKRNCLINAIVTIDPVINPMSNSSKMIVYSMKESSTNNGWPYSWDSQNGYNVVVMDYEKYFPILMSVEGVKHYNVFQRKGEGIPEYGLPQKRFGWPIGAAVQFAIAPKASDGISPPHDDVNYYHNESGPLLQYDASMNSHCLIVGKYWRWALRCLKDNFELPRIPVIESISPLNGMTGIEVEITGSFKTVTGLLIDDVDFDCISYQSDDLIKFTFPEAMRCGIRVVTLKDIKGHRSNGIGFAAGPLVTEIEPEMCFSGDTVTLNGFFGLSGNKVLIDDTLIRENYIIAQNDSMLKFVMPAAESGWKNVAVMTDYGLSNTIQLLIQPYIEKIEPSRAFPGEDALIIAQGIAGDNCIYIQDDKDTWININDGDKFRVPRIPGIRKIYIQNERGKSNIVDFYICLYAGNCKTKFIHSYDCQRENMIASKNKVRYLTLAEAYTQNYRDCNVCLPQTSATEGYIVNKRTGVIHKKKCPLVDCLLPQNLINYDFLDAARGDGYTKSCVSCKP